MRPVMRANYVEDDKYIVIIRPLLYEAVVTHKRRRRQERVPIIVKWADGTTGELKDEIIYPVRHFGISDHIPTRDEVRFIVKHFLCDRVLFDHEHHECSIDYCDGYVHALYADKKKNRHIFLNPPEVMTMGELRMREISSKKWSW